MAFLLSVNNLSKSFGVKTLFENLNFGISSRERIGLIGPNGAGKTTLLKILAGKEHEDSGEISYQRGLKIGFLEQSPKLNGDQTVLEAVCGEIPDHAEHWEVEARAYQIISQLGLDETVKVSSLSGGWKKKVALAHELVKEPDLLFLDEPTNHLDVESILWLEKFIADLPIATMIVTHDRLFLQRVTNRLLELDKRNAGGLLSINGTYTDYLKTKEDLMSAQEKRELALKNTLRRETEWLRQGAKARSTKQKARIERAGELKEEVEAISERNVVRTANINFESSALPKVLLEAKKISKSYGSKNLFSNFSLLLKPGSRVGLLGLNGSGKSSLIRVLLKKEKPDQGEIFHTDQLKIAYFEQNRDSLDPKVSLAKTLCPQGDFVTYRGQQVHIKSYLDRFLFNSIQMNMAVGKLSGGEQSRILIAQLMLQPANLLVLDEPTNDLDIATLNILENCLTEFEGAILLVTHDRYFLSQVANKIVAFPPNGSTKLEVFADLNQWEDAYAEMAQAPKETPQPPVVAQAATPAKKKKLTYKDQREFDSMEANIHGLEEKSQALEAECTKPEVVSNPTRLIEITKELGDLRAQIDKLYLRWAELEKMRE